ncbi:MAG: hypothetical protein COX16_14075 [Deltaproteobacteria bacterium CG23_combo_of_CG06-09_8_20_14_all_51_20]|nr:MoaD/ThiS family protein [bacterium]NCP09176.1 MoaD/ThiS family protein [bacterium]OIP38702.1 MAG: hypothetical protein AUK25_12220 [Desulfobacteraceae bacterium CG2_30_51_40]PIP45278.1 MAG: hypothetical protein COX16_14075 [Deltaproteobacteria bacterium CG23_combo_of_CG06-09_8_20_14_all_51_20]PIW01550.1 MAG: hypothetical protein COW41_02310 [Deltaproteobacteria bacterium CG17_big_fil_post_rev_8_21_14_2_50_51_6]
MIITVKSYGGLRKYTERLPKGGYMEIPEGASLEGAFTLLEIPPELPIVFFVNGRIAQRDRILKKGDSVVFFSPMEGG